MRNFFVALAVGLFGASCGQQDPAPAYTEKAPDLDRVAEVLLDRRPEEIAAMAEQSMDGATAFDVCAAISAEEISAIINQTMGDGVGEGAGCFWTSTLATNNPKSRRVMILLTEAALYEKAPGGVEAVLRQQADATARFDDDGNLVGGDPARAEAVAGIGDQAFWRGILAFRKGVWVANVDVQPRASSWDIPPKLDASEKEPELAIGRLLAAKLP